MSEPSDTVTLSIAPTSSSATTGPPETVTALSALPWIEDGVASEAGAAVFATSATTFGSEPMAPRLVLLTLLASLYTFDATLSSLTG